MKLEMQLWKLETHGVSFHSQNERTVSINDECLCKQYYSEIDTDINCLIGEYIPKLIDIVSHIIAINLCIKCNDFEFGKEIISKIVSLCLIMNANTEIKTVFQGSVQ